MLEATHDNKVILTFECSECGRSTLGPLPLTHLVSVIQILSAAAKELGMPLDDGSRLSANLATAQDHEAAQAQFESMHVDEQTARELLGLPASEASPWD